MWVRWALCTVAKGTEVTAYVNGNMPLDAAKFAPVAPAANIIAGSSTVSPQTNSSSAQLEITSTPTGAEISVDGNFVGDSPLEFTVAAGVHTITISKLGKTRSVVGWPFRILDVTVKRFVPCCVAVLSNDFSGSHP